MTAILLVTWFFGAGALNSYQVPFSTIFLCIDAKNQLQGAADAAVALANANMATRQIPGGGTVTPITRAPVPQLIAVCATTAQ